MNQRSGVPGGLAAGSRIALLYDELLGQTPDLLDGEVQRQAIARALIELGHEPIPIPCDLDLGAARERLRQCEPALVFNLVESLGGSDRLMPLATLLLESLGLPYTGCPTAAIVATNDKPASKRRMRELGLPTPACRRLAEGNATPHEADAMRFPTEVIIKSVAEHASIGLDDASVVTVDSEAELAALLIERSRSAGRELFAERFVRGREFNLSLLDGRALPPAEIVFENYPEGKPRIVGYAAKWVEASPEYDGTPRTFEFTADDAPLLERLGRIAEACWNGFGLAGAARVDFRTDEAGEPWILEVNANPCLNPDGGFAAACGQAGIGYVDMIGAIVAAGARRSD